MNSSSLLAGGGGKWAAVILLLGACTFPAVAQIDTTAPGGEAPQGTVINLSSGRIRSWSSQTQMTASVQPNARQLDIFVNWSPDWTSWRAYTLAPGETRTFQYPSTVWLCSSFTRNRGESIQYNASSMTEFKLNYFAFVPQQITWIYDIRLTRELNYLSFLMGSARATVYAPWDIYSPSRWNLNLNMQERGCHQYRQGCADLSLNIVRNTTGGGGTHRFLDPPALGAVARSVRQGTISFSYTHDSQSQMRIASVQNRHGSATTTASVSDNHYSSSATLDTSADYATGLIMVDKLRFLQSLDPLGVTELGENELVFKEQDGVASLEIPFGCRVMFNPPALLYSAYWDGLQWFADRMRLYSTFPIADYETLWGYANLTNELFIAFRTPGGRGLSYPSTWLPEWYEFGRHRIQVEFVPILGEDNFSSFIMGQADFEVFFPATGRRHPGNLVDPYTGQRVPNWFYYYWRAMGQPAAVYTTQGSPNAGGFYITGQSYVHVRDHLMNYLSSKRPLFALRQGQCPMGVPRTVVTHVDDITMYGIHGFAFTVYHEFGHKWSYETYWQAAPGVMDRIWRPQRAFDNDGDDLLDAWENAHGLCPYRRHTTDAYLHIGDEISGSPGDPEVLADVVAYGDLLDNANLWRHDWSNLGLQKGNPLERFVAFPWYYESTRRNQSAHSDLLTGWGP